MASLKKYNLAIVAAALIFVQCHFVFGDQPSLPTLVYGYVVNPDGTPAEGVTVTAKYTDGLGDENTITTKTLTIEENKEYAGHYFFNQGYLQAKPDTDIIIEVGGAKRYVKSSPGSDSISVEPVVINPADVSGETTSKSPWWAPWKADGEGLGSGSGGGSGSGLGGGSGSGSGGGGGTDSVDDVTEDYGANADFNDSFEHNSDINGGMNQNDHGDIKWESVDEGEISIPSETFTEDTDYITGEILDDLGNPVPDEEITAEWTDDSDVKHKETIKTTKRGRPLQNRSSGGAFRFANIKPKPNTKIQLKTRDNLVIKTEIREVTTALSTLNFQTNMETNAVLNESTVVQDEVKRNVWISLIAVIFIILIILFFYRKRIKKRMKLLEEKMQVNKIVKAVFQMRSLKAEEFMTKKIVKINKFNSLLQGVDKLVSENLNSLIVGGDSGPPGLITQRDIIRNLNFQEKNFEKIKLAEIMSLPLKTIDSRLSYSQVIAYALKNNLTKMPVVKNKKLAGIITLTDLAIEFNKFVSKNTVRTPDIPTINDIISDNLLIANENENMVDSIRLMVQNDANCVLITNSQNEVVGILSEKDFIEELFKNPFNVDKLDVKQVVYRNFFSIRPETDLFEVNKILLDKNIKRVVIMQGKELLGVVTLLDVVKAIDLFIKKYTPTK
ncbi:MAG: CBS domain-containing protein [Nanoarchaeota archaeon]